jgi:hypothetical protein
MTKNPILTDPPDTWPPGLGQLVAAVRAPARPDELAGEDAMAAAFRAAGKAVPRRAARSLARMLAVKLAAGVAVLAAGGYAVAASTGALPLPHFVPDRSPVPATAPSAGAPELAGPAIPTGAASEPPAATATEPPTGTPSATGRPAESYAGLCRTYISAPPTAAARLLDTLPMRDLIVAAGGEERVREFCTSAVGPWGHPSPGGTGSTPDATKAPNDKSDKTGPPPEPMPRSPQGGGPV